MFIFANTLRVIFWKLLSGYENDASAIKKKPHLTQN